MAPESVASFDGKNAGALPGVLEPFEIKLSWFLSNCVYYVFACLLFLIRVSFVPVVSLFDIIFARK